MKWWRWHANAIASVTATYVSRPLMMDVTVTVKGRGISTTIKGRCDSIMLPLIILIKIYEKF